MRRSHLQPASELSPHGVIGTVLGNTDAKSPIDEVLNPRHAHFDHTGRLHLSDRLQRDAHMFVRPLSERKKGQINIGATRQDPAALLMHRICILTDMSSRLHPITIEIEAVAPPNSVSVQV